MADKANWVLQKSCSFSDRHDLLYRDDALGVQKEVYTPVVEDRAMPPEFGDPEVYYFVDGSEEEFASEEALLAAVARKEEGKGDETT